MDGRKGERRVGVFSLAGNMFYVWMAFDSDSEIGIEIVGGNER